MHFEAFASQKLGDKRKVIRHVRIVVRIIMNGPMLQAILEDRFSLKVHWEQ